MTNEIRAQFGNEIAEITINRRKTKDATKSLFRELNSGELGYWEWDKKQVELLKSDFYCSRSTARHTMLAYGYLNGKSYKDIEYSCREEPNASNIAAIAGVNAEDIRDWLRGE